VAVTSRERDEDAHREPPPVPWHNRTSTVLGASLAAVTAIAIVVTSIGYVSRQFTEPEQAPVNYIGPAFSSTESSSSPSTTTATATVISTSPPVTSDINPDLTPSSTTDSSESSTSRNPASRSPRTREAEPDDESTTRTTRNRPRTNVTRTLNPAP